MNKTTLKRLKIKDKSLTNQVKNLQKKLNSMKKVKSKPKKKPKKMKRMRIPSGLSKCAIKYAYAIGDPFHSMAKGACIPMGAVGNTAKISTKKTFTLTVGTGGYASVCIVPTGCNDVISILYTSSTYAATSAVVAATSGVAGVSTITLSELNAGSATYVGTGNIDGYRLVAAGLKVTYTGSDLYKGGTMWSYVPPDRDNLAGVDLNTVTNNPACHVRAVDRKPLTISQYPLYPVEKQFSSENVASPALQKFPLSRGNDIATNTYPTTAAIVVQSSANNTFLCEVVYHYEFIGTGTTYMQTPSDSDIIGEATVSQVAATSNNDQTTTSYSEAFFKNMDQNFPNWRNTAKAYAAYKINEILNPALRMQRTLNY